MPKYSDGSSLPSNMQHKLIRKTVSISQFLQRNTIVQKLYPSGWYVTCGCYQLIGSPNDYILVARIQHAPLSCGTEGSLLKVLPYTSKKVTHFNAKKNTSKHVCYSCRNSYRPWSLSFEVVFTIIQESKKSNFFLPLFFVGKISQLKIYSSLSVYCYTENSYQFYCYIFEYSFKTVGWSDGFSPHSLKKHLNCKKFEQASNIDAYKITADKATKKVPMSSLDVGTYKE